MNNGCSLGILIPSCDNYSDAWEPFFKLFFEYWPEVRYPIYLLSNNMEHKHDRVISKRIGPDIDWSTNLRAALSQIKESHILIILEDYFLTDVVDDPSIEKLFCFQCERDIGYLRLYPCPGPQWISGSVAGYDVGVIDKGVPYRASLQAAIWRKSVLEELLREGESAWQFEADGTRRSNDIVAPFFSVAGDASRKLPLKYLCTAIVGKYWTKEAVSFCSMHSIPLDLQRRRIEPWYKRMKRHRWYQIYLMSLKKLGSAYRRGLQADVSRTNVS